MYFHISFKLVIAILMDPMALLVPIQDNVLARITLKDNNVIIVRITFLVFLHVNLVNAIRVDQMA